MPLSIEEEARLNELKGKIEALKKEINDCKKDINDYEAALPPGGGLTDKDREYLMSFSNNHTALNNRLNRFEAEARELRSKASGVSGTGSASSNDFRDISINLYNDLTTPFDSEPSLEELPALLCTDPLVQFPIHPFYAELLKTLTHTQLVNRLFRSSTSEYCNMVGNLINLAQMDVVLDSNCEATLHHYVDSLIKDVLHKILSFSDLAIHTSRNDTDISSATESRECPDFLFYVNQFLILRGEEEKSRDELIIAKGKLIEKLKAWNVVTFGHLKYIIGFACAGEYLTFCALSSCGKISDISSIFNLKSAVHRLQIVICVINLARLFRTLAPRIPKKMEMMYQPILRHNGCIIEIQDQCVLKRIPIFIHEFQKRYEYLDLLYDTMHKERVPHVIECVEISKYRKKRGNIMYIELQFKPCGVESIPDSMNLLVSALKSVLLALQGVHKIGYVHRDIRWPNLLFVTDTDWRLIDFENSSRGDSALMKKDMHMVGTLMSSCESLVNSSAVLRRLREQLISENPPNASEALAIFSECTCG